MRRRVVDARLHPAHGQRLAEARGRLIDALKSGDEEAVGPAIQQFIPALLGALRIGINLVGRSKVVGFLGAYTTFSTLMLDSWRLVEDGLPALALVNLLASMALGVVAVVAGLWVGRVVG